VELNRRLTRGPAFVGGSEVLIVTATAFLSDRQPITIHTSQTQILDRGHGTAEMKPPHAFFVEAARISRLPLHKNISERKKSFTPRGYQAL
jgi:hypothetical protein